MSTFSDGDAVILSIARTPIGRFQGAFGGLTAPELGAVAARAAVDRAGVADGDIEEALFGNVVSAGVGQAPARQAVLGAGLPQSVPCTTVNKVCASGMKTTMLAANLVQAGARDVVLCGGFESMSNAPYYLPKAREGLRLGHGQVLDGVVHDGLWDCYNDQHMGLCGEKCASDYGFSREDQDAYAADSYARAQEAWAAGLFAAETVPVPVKQRRGAALLVDRDEEPFATDPAKLPQLRPAFKKDGTVTAANASSLNDGAFAAVVSSGKFARERRLSPLARVLGAGDAARDPVDFTVAPADAVPIALRNAGVSLSDVDYHEINEAFSVVALANAEILGLDRAKVNVNGGAVALGHPIGMSGGRIVGTLLSVLAQRDATIGCASICNGGGGASAIVIERLA